MFDRYDLPVESFLFSVQIKTGTEEVSLSLTIPESTLKSGLCEHDLEVIIKDAMNAVYESILYKSVKSSSVD